MSIDKDSLGKGLIRLGVLVFLLIISPIIITMGFKALDKYTEAPQSLLAYFVIIIGIATTIFTITFAFLTFKMIKKSLFKQNKPTL